ncbi:helix-turn-helix transcriptional regulator [Peristeroidobacter agariperforans]|uniref:helix-turn-helix transcriptional regulator n=1 Tax=Peristeroidobacter agariperforans TaxID=268404 RepID=UPI001E608A95|nr:AlpA family phage regulatory protein [Peristeroidobacter agariperforans]
MNSYSSRSLRAIPTAPAATRLAGTAGHGESHALAGRAIASVPPAQSQVPHDVQPTTPIRMLRLSQVAAITGLSKTKIYQLQIQGDFPMRVQLSPRRVAWVESEVQAWLAARITSSTPLIER